MACAGAGLLLKDYTLWKEPMLEQFRKSCSPLEGLTLEKFGEDYLLSPHAGVEEEAAIETT